MKGREEEQGSGHERGVGWVAKTREVTGVLPRVYLSTKQLSMSIKKKKKKEPRQSRTKTIGNG